MKLKIFDKSGSNTSDAVLLVQKAVLKTNLKPNLEDQAARREREKKRKQRRERKLDGKGWRLGLSINPMNIDEAAARTRSGCAFNLI
ncbi:hypothetical protein QE152_g19045 [Popillia japonica]|uniref:Uncharacterized protein n=1 Tax=Popillia japonica TaxID=7064 RepID=A0AAW1KYT1_POPJA